MLRIDSWSGPPGGAQEYVRTVSEELARAGHAQQRIEITDWPSDPRATGVHTATVPRSEAVRFPRDILSTPSLERTLESALREFRPEIVHVHHFDAAFGSLARILSRTDVPLVFTAHDAELVCPISTLVRPGTVICEGGVRPRCLFTGCRVGVGGPYNLLQTAVFDTRLRDRFRAYLCPSRRLVEYLHAHGYQPAIHLPPFARLPPEVVAAAYPPPTPDASISIGYIGRLEWYKGVEDLIRAVKLLADRFPGVQLDIAGDGAFRGHLELLATKLGLRDRVRFRGHLTGAAKEEWFRRVQLTVVPSNMWENFGLVAIEALARGRPVVATNFGGLPDVVEDGVTGRLVPLSDPAALADAIGDLLGDPAQSRALAGEGRRRVLEEFTAPVHLQRLLSVYRAVLDGRDLPSRTSAKDLP